MKKGDVLTPSRIVEAFLGFLAQDIRSRPSRKSGLSKRGVRRAVTVTKAVKATDDDIIPTSVTI